MAFLEQECSRDPTEEHANNTSLPRKRQFFLFFNKRQSILFPNKASQECHLWIECE